MSWSTSISSTPASKVSEALESKRESALALIAAHHSEQLAAATEQFNQAVAAVRYLAVVCVPDEETLVNVTMSGHANPGHAPSPGWANDALTVSVTQVSS